MKLAHIRSSAPKAMRTRLLLGFKAHPLDNGASRPNFTLSRLMSYQQTTPLSHKNGLGLKIKITQK